MRKSMKLVLVAVVAFALGWVARGESARTNPPVTGFRVLRVLHPSGTAVVPLDLAHTVTLSPPDPGPPARPKTFRVHHVVRDGRPIKLHEAPDDHTLIFRLSMNDGRTVLHLTLLPDEAP